MLREKRSTVLGHQDLDLAGLDALHQLTQARAAEQSPAGSGLVGFAAHVLQAFVLDQLEAQVLLAGDAPLALFWIALTHVIPSRRAW